MVRVPLTKTLRSISLNSYNHTGSELKYTHLQTVNFINITSINDKTDLYISEILISCINEYILRLRLVKKGHFTGHTSCLLYMYNKYKLN